MTINSRRAFLRSLASLPLVGGWIAIMSKTAVAGAAFPTGTLPGVSTLQEGHALARLNGALVTIDMARFQPEPDDRVVVAHFDGSLSIKPVIFEDMAPWYGKRSAATEWKLTRPGGRSESDRVWIVGRVLSAAGVPLTGRSE